LVVFVTSANTYDGNAGVKLLPKLVENFKKITTITADGTYRKTFEKAGEDNNIKVEITQKTESIQGFIPQKNRWQVERSFSWLNFYRRLSKDYEKKAKNSEVMIKLAFICLNLNHFI
jgi:putative transposase